LVWLWLLVSWLWVLFAAECEIVVSVAVWSIRLCVGVFAGSLWVVFVVVLLLFVVSTLCPGLLEFGWCFVSVGRISGSLVAVALAVRSFLVAGAGWLGFVCRQLWLLWFVCWLLWLFWFVCWLLWLFWCGGCGVHVGGVRRPGVVRGVPR